MKFITAKQAWHDAFKSDVASIDYRDAINNFNVQFSAKGSGNVTLDHCEKAKIQSAVSQLANSDPLAKAWGMYAYAPDDMCPIQDKARVFSYLQQKYNEWTKNSFCRDRSHQVKVGMIIRMAMHDVMHKEWDHKYTVGNISAIQRRQALKCPSSDHWDAEWKPVMRKIRGWLGDLPGRALTPVGYVVYGYQEKQVASV